MSRHIRTHRVVLGLVALLAEESSIGCVQPVIGCVAVEGFVRAEVICVQTHKLCLTCHFKRSEFWQAPFMYSLLCLLMHLSQPYQTKVNQHYAFANAWESPTAKDQPRKSLCAGDMLLQLIDREPTSAQCASIALRPVCEEDLHNDCNSAKLHHFPD